MTKLTALKEQKALPTVSLDDELEGLTVDEALAKVAMLLAQTSNPKTLSELDDTEIRLCAQLYAVCSRTDDEMLLAFLLNFLLLRVSNARKGRSELLDVARSGQEREANKVSRLRNIFSMGGRI